jgi:hypothetical protein
MRLQSQGFSQAPGVAAQLFQGGGFGATETRQRESMEMTRELFENAVAAGMDKAAAGRAMTTMAQRAEQLGFGGQARAALESQQQMGLAQRLFGQNVDDPQLRQAQSLQQRLGETRGGSMQEISGFMAAKEFAQQMGIELTPEEEIDFTMRGTDPEFQRKLLAKKGKKGVSPEQAAATAGALAIQAKGRIAAAGTVGGTPEEQARLLALTPEFAGEGRTEAGIESLTKTLSAGAAGRPFEMAAGKSPEETRRLLEESRAGAVGAGISDAISKTEMTMIAGGLKTLGDQLPVLNSAFSKLIDRANGVLADEGARTPSRFGPGPTGSPFDTARLLQKMESFKNSTHKE